MASEILRLSDVIVPSVYEQYIIEQSIYKNAFVRSGIMQTSASLSAKVGGGGEVFTLPFWKDLTGDPEPINSDTTLETKKTTADYQRARRLLFGRGWSAEEIASAEAGSNAMDAITSMVDGYWNRFFNKVLFSTIKGIMADNITNDSSDLVNDITTSGTPGSSNKISSTYTIDTKKLIGDRLDDFVGCAMHSAVYAQLQTNNLITFVPYSQQGGIIPTYMGMNVVVDDGLTPDTDGANSEYWTIFFRSGAVQYGESGNNITVVETDRVAADSEDRLFTRRQFAMHPVGWKWVENSVASDMPTLSEIQEAGNWDRVFNKQNCGICVLISNG